MSTLSYIIKVLFTFLWVLLLAIFFQTMSVETIDMRLIVVSLVISLILVEIMKKIQSSKI